MHYISKDKQSIVTVGLISTINVVILYKKVGLVRIYYNHSDVNLDEYTVANISDIAEFNENLLAQIYNNGNVDCTNCTNCYCCIGCKDCKNCINCSGCIKCTDCITCTNCNLCTKCSNNLNCNMCTSCDTCFDCISCTSCVCCLKLKSLKDKNNIKNV